jgi:hypothetical protein
MKNFSAILILITSLSQPVQAASNPMGDMMYTMFRMMLAMANHMASSFDSTGSFNMGNSSGSGLNPWMSNWPGTGWPGSWPMTGMSPWSSPGFGSPWSTTPYSGFPSGNGAPSYPGWQRGGASPNRYNGAAPVSALDGQWLGRSGEVLEVSGNRFRLRSLYGSITGTIQIDKRQLKLYSPQTGVVMPYRYERNWSGLTLRDPYGRMLVFEQRPTRYRRY